MNVTTFFTHFSLALDRICSTNHALISIAESIRSSVDNKEFGCGIFIDLKKAFDTVNHSILLLKLYHYGVRGKAYEWFQSYLANRKQFVCVNGHNSDSLSLTCGVPQGSVLGPLLFLLYVNDLPNTSSLLTFHLFADDTNIYYSCKNLDDLESKLNHELKVPYLFTYKAHHFLREKKLVR